MAFSIVENTLVTVFSTALNPDWNAPAIGFYRSLGAVPMDEWTVNRVEGEALARLAGSGETQG